MLAPGDAAPLHCGCAVLTTASPGACCSVTSTSFESALALTVSPLAGSL